MRKISLLTAITLMSWFGWKLGESYGLMTAYWMSFVGSLAGVFVGCTFNRKYLD